VPAWSITFEVAFDVDPASVPGGGDWTDLSSRLIADAPIRIKQGKNRLSGEAHGSASLVLDNSDRGIDPTNPDATFNLVPRRHARLTATIGVPTHDLFSGFVDAWLPTWSSYDSQVTVQLVDGFAWLALQDDDIDRPAELSSARISAYLDAAEWPAGLRSIDTGLVILLPVAQDGANLYRSALDVTDAEAGDLYCDPGGTVTYKNRHARLDQSASVTFGEGGIAFEDVTPVWDTSALTNRAVVELADGDTYEYSNAASMGSYGTVTTTIRDLALPAAEAEGLAQWEVYRYKDLNLWLDRLTVSDCETDTLGTILPLRIGDLANVVHYPPAGGTVNVQKNIERWTHTIGAMSWRTEFDLSPYFGEGPWLTLGTIAASQLGTVNKLAP